MQKDDRIFAVVGACFVTAVALVAALIWLGSGITVDAPQRATVTMPQPSIPAPVTSLDSDGAIELYRQFRPRLEAIYREVGWANDDFDTRLREAVDHLLEVTTSSGQLEVEQRAIVYAYAEDRFENLTGAQKHFLRMGPRNVDAIQSKLRSLRDANGWPAPVPAIVTAELEQPAESDLLAAPVIADAVRPLVTDSMITETGAIEEP